MCQQTKRRADTSEHVLCCGFSFVVLEGIIVLEIVSVCVFRSTGGWIWSVRAGGELRLWAGVGTETEVLSSRRRCCSYM